MSETGSPKVSFERERGVYALQVLHDVAHAVIGFGDDSLRTGRIQQVLRVLADANIPVFLVKLHRSAVTLAFAGSDVQRAEAALDQSGLRTTIQHDLALLNIRAASMRELHGVMIAIADALFESGAHLYETGDSHNTVQCLIDGSHVEASISALCRAFHLEPQSVSYARMQTEGVA